MIALPIPRRSSNTICFNTVDAVLCLFRNTGSIVFQRCASGSVDDEQSWHHATRPRFRRQADSFSFKRSLSVCRVCRWRLLNVRLSLYPRLHNAVYYLVVTLLQSSIARAVMIVRLCCHHTTDTDRANYIPSHEEPGWGIYYDWLAVVDWSTSYLCTLHLSFQSEFSTIIWRIKFDMTYMRFSFPDITQKTQLMPVFKRTNKIHRQYHWTLLDKSMTPQVASVWTPWTLYPARWARKSTYKSSESSPLDLI